MVCAVGLLAVDGNRAPSSVVESFLAADDLANHSLWLAVLVAQDLHVNLLISRRCGMWGEDDAHSELVRMVSKVSIQSSVPERPLHSHSPHLAEFAGSFLFRRRGLVLMSSINKLTT